MSALAYRSALVLAAVISGCTATSASSGVPVAGSLDGSAPACTGFFADASGRRLRAVGTVAGQQSGFAQQTAKNRALSEMEKLLDFFLDQLHRAARGDDTTAEGVGSTSSPEVVLLALSRLKTNLQAQASLVHTVPSSRGALVVLELPLERVAEAIVGEREILLWVRDHTGQLAVEVFERYANTGAPDAACRPPWAAHQLKS